MASVHDQEPVEALGADGADEAFGDRVRFRRSHRRLDDPDAFAYEDGVEVAGELAVAVTDQEAKQSPRLLARLLVTHVPVGFAVKPGESLMAKGLRTPGHLRVEC